MGRNRSTRSTVTGLSRFIQVLKESETINTDDDALSPSIAPNSDHPRSPESIDDQRPAKKRKTGLLGPGNEKYDATSLVQFYINPSEVPEHLKKCKHHHPPYFPQKNLLFHAIMQRILDFYQRTRYFSLYDSGCLLDEEGWYSVTPERIADQIAERCRCDTILDAFCGVGGNAIAFAKTCERVIAIDNSSVRLALARHNATIYGVVDRIEFILGDYISFARSQSSTFQSSNRKIDAIFLSPPWGGPSYLTRSSPQNSNTSSSDLPDDLHPEFYLSDIKLIHGAELFELSKKITPNIAYFLPRNTNLEDISSLTRIGGTNSSNGEGEMVEVEEEWMGDKLKALTCYYGGLVQGQEHLF